MRIFRIPLVFFLPIASIVLVVLWGGGIGGLFIALNETGLGEWGAVIVGIALVLLVPAIAFLAIRMVKDDV